MRFYVKKGAREVAKDPSNLMSDEEYQLKVEQESAVKQASSQ